MHYQRALELYRLRRYDLAKAELAKGLAKDPQDARCLGLLAACSLCLGDSKTALQQAQQALRSDPALAFTHHIMACAQSNLGLFYEAEIAIEEALRLQPKEPNYLAVFANIKFATGSLGQGLELLDQALALDPTNNYCLRLKHSGLVKSHRFKEAEAVREHALSLNPEDAHMHAASGWQELKKGVQPDFALSHFEEALRLNPMLDSSVGGLLEARYQKTFYPRLTKVLPKWAVYLLVALSLVVGCVTTQLAPTSWLNWVLLGFVLLVVVLRLCGDTISRALFKASLLADKRDRAIVTEHTKKQWTGKKGLENVAVVGAVALAVVAAWTHAMDHMPAWLFANWNDMISKHYAFGAPLAFAGAVGLALYNSILVVWTLITGSPRTTKFFYAIIFALMGALFAFGFVIVGVMHSIFALGVAFVFILGVVIAIGAQKDRLEAYVKSEVRKDLERCKNRG